MIGIIDAYLSLEKFKFMDGAKAPEVLLKTRPDLIDGFPDSVLALIAPIIVYWVMSSIFHLIDVYKLSEKYRIHPTEEQLSKNKATFEDVLKDVALQHMIQTIVGLVVYYFDAIPMTGYEINAIWVLQNVYLKHCLPNAVVYYFYWYGISCFKLFFAFVIIDTWQFFLHRWMHLNKYMYKHFHSRHHRLYVPYAFGALYNAPLEGFLLDTCGTGVAMFVSQLTPRESIVLFIFATMKTVDDHCGYAYPYDPFQMLFPNNSIYHDIHHQAFGIKYHFAQPFFTFWDTLFKSDYKDLEKYRINRQRVTIEMYHQFLLDRKKTPVTIKEKND